MKGKTLCFTRIGIKEIGKRIVSNGVDGERRRKRRKQRALPIRVGAGQARIRADGNGAESGISRWAIDGIDGEIV